MPIINFSSARALEARYEGDDGDNVNYDDDDNEDGDSATPIIMANERGGMASAYTRHAREFLAEF